MSKRTKKATSFKAKLIAMILIPMILLTLILEGVGLYFMIKMARSEVEEQLTSFATSTVQRYNELNDKKYSYCGNGMMKGAIQISENYTVMDILKEETNIDTTIFWGNESVASTLTDENGARMVGTTVSNETILDAVLKNGEEYYNTNFNIGGVEYFGAYTPLTQPDSGEVIGMIFTGKPKSDVISQLNQSLGAQFVVAAVLFIIMMITSIFSIKKMASALKYSEVEINKIADGVLDFTYEKQHMDRMDEIGSVTKATKNVAEKLSGIIGNIVRSSDDLDDYSGKFKDAFGNMNQNLSNINVAVGEIANGATNQAMETQNANNGVQNIGQAIDETMDQVLALNHSTEKMTEYNKTVQETIHGLGNINDRTKESVAVVYEQTTATNTSANDIRTATELITSIASQTNLLSLNASIEAARAGEMGKGFAVVADEIRQLSEQSKSAAEQIGSIVSSLLDNSNRSVHTMNDMTEIIEKQNSMIDETKSVFQGLNSEIDSVSVAVDQIDTKIRTLADIKEQVYGIIENLAAIAEENAASTEETSAAMNELDQTMQMCDSITEEIFAIAQHLESEVSMFTFNTSNEQ